MVAWSFVDSGLHKSFEYVSGYFVKYSIGENTVSYTTIAENVEGLNLDPKTSKQATSAKDIFDWLAANKQ